MKSAVVLGNGESRSWFCPDYLEYPIADLELWGCNAIYRDGVVDNLVSMDYAMQQEIYMSGYPLNNKCWFANWTRVPTQVAEMMMMGTTIPKEFVHWPKSNASDECVISGKDPATVQTRIDEMMKDFPHLDTEDLKLKMEKDVGVWITPVFDEDRVQNISNLEGWSAGNVGLFLAAENGATEVYMLGFDLSSYDEPLNNIYKGTENYLPGTARGFNPVNWIIQMNSVFKKYRDVTFYWVDSRWKDYSDKFFAPNIKHIDKNTFLDKVGSF